MCKFQKKLKKREIDCYFSKVNYSINRVPIDEQGLCVFHSENEIWKIENGFTVHLEELINYFEEEPLEKYIFLEDIIFTSKIENFFNNKKFKKDINFNRSQFKGNLTIESSGFKNLSFKLTVFNETVSFNNLSINKVSFDDSHFKSKIVIDNSDFFGDFFMLNTQFGGGISITNSIFHSFFFFNKIRTNIDKSIRGGIVFKQIHFKKFSTFELSEFNSVTDFKNITVHAELIFDNTQFNYADSLPIVASVTFEQIIIKEKGKFEFKGDANNKIFSKVQDVSFTKEEIEGKLLFEHTDFTKFNLTTKNRLINAAMLQNAKIFIGIGCLKYHNQTPVKSIEIDDDNQSLVVELCNTFVDYFTKNRGYNLGVQFVSKTDQKINFFYFSDEIVSYDEFEAQLQKSEQHMWRLIKIENDNLKSQLPKNNLPSKIVNATDTIVNLISLVLKIGSRIPLGLISKEEVSGLLNTTLPLNTKSNNGFIVNQIVIFGLKNTQSFQVKKLG